MSSIEEREPIYKQYNGLLPVFNWDVNRWLDEESHSWEATELVAHNIFTLCIYYTRLPFAKQTLAEVYNECDADAHTIRRRQQDRGLTVLPIMRQLLNALPHLINLYQSPIDYIMSQHITLDIKMVLTAYFLFEDYYDLHQIHNNILTTLFS